MESLIQDLRYAVRQLIKSPGFTALAIATFALGIGPATAVLSFVQAINFSVVLIRIKVEVVTAVPLTAATVTEVASPIGAA